MIQFFPFTSFTARVLGKKIKFISRVTLTVPPSEGSGRVDPLVLNVISAPLLSELLDVIAGFACSSMMVVHRENLSLSTRIMFEGGITTMPLMVVDWLNNWPIGLKLNTELSKFCSQTFIVIISSWNYWLQGVLEVAFYGFPCIGLFGASTLAAFAADVIRVATLHLHMCYIITTTVVYGLRLSTSTLWNLFQGKCYNQLCNRNDKWPYEMDHLVLGTIFLFWQLF